MTNEEAISVLKVLASFQGVMEYLEQHSVSVQDACNMAIQALSQEPTDTWSIKDVADAFKKHGLIGEQEPCDDAISRDAVKELIKSGVSTDTYDDVEQVCKWIDALPPVTQKSEKWIKIKSGDKDFPESIVCSRCSNENSHLDFNENAEPIGKVFVTSKYCPNCGAKMESEDKK